MPRNNMSKKLTKYRFLFEVNDFFPFQNFVTSSFGGECSQNNAHTPCPHQHGYRGTTDSNKTNSSPPATYEPQPPEYV